ncbi:PREDICTED: protein kinase C-binding protein 1 [Trachymyrmex cornetzi]|uniref:protein kinase C-binding protein 1 n=1 Tax=Trachymyrmex cornetzi TaxID=471704 RepID=UPI00084F47CA|nr:PREDICTED: protein kinase C-binding protein 1 [Trachymyrmex cornetzi]
MASGLPNVHQKKLGPAPIASFEDLSEEVENGESAAAAAAAAAVAAGRMPGIVEVTTPATPGSSLKTPSTPRIDISRASSSSHHEDSNSRDSSPERELLAGADPPSGCKLTLGYKEDAQDLRSSTEELDLQDPIHEQDLKRESKRRKRKETDGSQSDYSGKQLGQDRERKDSNCSEICLLNISGRTSRLSSVGSQGSGVSGKLSVMSATSSRSPSPHKCLLETSFCGSKPTLADNLIEPSKPETDDLEKILLKREADTTKALIPESIKVPMVGGNLKPDPLDKPRRRGREERKEIFKREVEITKRFLEKVNIEVPIIKKSGQQQGSVMQQQHQQQKQQQQQQYQSKIQIQEVQKPATLDFNDKRKKAQNFKEIVQTTPTTSSLTGSPKLPRHQKVRDLEGSRTPSPSSVSRKSSFASLFKTRADGNVLSPESPSPSTKPRRSLTSKLKDTTESLRSRSKSRERVSVDKGSILKKDSKNKGVFSSTLSLFKKRERKKSYDEAIAASCDLEVASGDEHPSLESIGHVEFTFNAEKEKNRQDDSIFISLHADDRNYEEALPSESVSIPLETPTKLLDEYESEGPHTGSIITEVSIEHHPSSIAKIRTEAQIETVTAQIASRSSSRDSQLSQSEPKDSYTLKSSLKDSKISAQANKIVGTPPLAKSSTTHVKSDIKLAITSEIKSTDLRTLSGGLSRESTGKKPDITKPKRKSKENQQQQQQQQQQQRQPELSERISDDVAMQQKRVSSDEPSRAAQETKRLDHLDDKIGKSLEQEGLVKAPSVISDLDHNSSESERDSEIEFIRNKVEKLTEELPDERKGLFYEESFEEDLPYVPTTLPLEKSVAVPILPVKQRLQEVRTIPIERPRSTTPINPTLLDEFVMQTSLDERRVERMKISLPREDSFKLKSPRRQYTSTANTFTEFAGKVPPDGGRKGATNQGKSPTAAAAAAAAASSSSSSSSSSLLSSSATSATAAARLSNWINFEEIPEKRKAPKRIQTIPRPEDEIAKTVSGGYNYVQPEECKCECHEESVGGGSSVDRASIVSDSSLECSLSLDDSQSTQVLLGNSTKPFAMDLDVRSNRSSIISQEENDENQHQ